MNNNGSPFYIGVVEDRSDHLMLGRCKVRVVGLHIQDKDMLPTADLPWAMTMVPANSAGSSGIGVSPVGPVEGSTVLVIFNDPPYNQQPIIIGVLQGIPQCQQIINDTLDIVPMFKDNISEVGREIPTNYDEATVNQLTPFDPQTFASTPEGVLMSMIKAQGSIVSALQLQLLSPNLSLDNALKITSSLYSNTGFYTGDVSPYSGATDGIYKLTGDLGTPYGGVNLALGNVNIAVNAITSGAGGTSPIISFDLLPHLFDTQIDSKGNEVYVYPNEVARFQNEIQSATTTNSSSSSSTTSPAPSSTISNVASWTACMLSPPSDLDQLTIWAQQCLPASCQEQLAQVIVECSARNAFSPENIVPCVLDWATNCVMTGGSYNSTLEYSVGTSSLNTLPNLASMWSGITGVSLGSDGTVAGLIGGLTGYPQGVSSGAMIIANTVDAARTGVANAAAALASQSFDSLIEYASSGSGVMSVAYPAWSLSASHATPYTSSLPEPTGLFATAGNASVNQMIEPLPDISSKLMITGTSGSTNVSQTSNVVEQRLATPQPTSTSRNTPLNEVSSTAQSNVANQLTASPPARAERMALFAEPAATTSEAPATQRSPASATSTSASTTSATSTSTSASTTSTVSSGGIPTTPPPGYDQQEKRSQGIKALLKAADKLQLTTKAQKAALVAICGGECSWIPVEESHRWSSPDRLMNTFQSAFRGDRGLAQRYANWQGSKSAFFEFVYSHTHSKGRGLGNIQAGDGGKYYGRGFIQLTGRANYEKYATISGYDIVSNPQLLVTNIDVSAEIAVHYLKDRVQKSVIPSSSPGYFEAAAKAVNGKYEIEKKRRLYDYFYGTPSPASFQYTAKEAGAEAPTSYSGRMGQTISEGSRFPIPGCKPSRQTGFADPHNKYPLKTNTFRQDTNPLARGAAKETIVPVKNSRRVRDIRLPFGQGFIEQPEAPYAAAYPYNHVMETESGHIQEFDDTPNAERIHTYHRSGTFTEIDASGTQVTRIVGDGYTLIDRDGCIFVEGQANISVNGNINIYCRSDVNIQSEGSVHLESGGSFDLKVANDFEIAVGGKFKVWSTGGNYIHTDKVTSIFSKNEFYNFAVNRLANVTSGTWFGQGESGVNLHSANSMYLYANHVLDVYGSTRLSLDSDTIIDVDGNQLYLNSGTGVKKEAEKDSGMRFPPEPIATPAIGCPISHRQTGTDIQDRTVATLQSQRYFYETPEDYATPAGQAYLQNELSQQGQYNLFNGEQASGLTGGVDRSPVSSANIPNTSDPNQFTNDFRLSTNFNLGMLIVPYPNSNHKLRAQHGLTLQQIVTNLANVAQNILEPLVAANNPILPGGVAGRGVEWRITSGFRNGNGSKVSQHEKGMAVDIALTHGSNRQQRTFELIQQIEKVIPYDQIILEYAGANSVWIHISYNPEGRRKSAFTMRDGSTVTQGFRLLA